MKHIQKLENVLYISKKKKVCFRGLTLTSEDDFCNFLPEYLSDYVVIFRELERTVLQKTEGRKLWAYNSSLQINPQSLLFSVAASTPVQQVGDVTCHNKELLALSHNGSKGKCLKISLSFVFNTSIKLSFWE
jgi:hypothetical protein